MSPYPTSSACAVRTAGCFVLGIACALGVGCSGTDAPQGVAEDPIVKMATGPEGVRLTDELPRNVPIFRRAVPVSVLDRGEEGVEVGFFVDAEAGSVEEWYAGELERDGWQIERQAVQNQGATMIARKGAETLLVLIAGATSGDGPVNILLTYSESPPR